MQKKTNLKLLAELQSTFVVGNLKHIVVDIECNCQVAHKKAVGSFGKTEDRKRVDCKLVNCKFVDCTFVGDEKSMADKE